MTITNIKRNWGNYLMLFAGVFMISWSAILVKLAGVSGFASGFYRMLFGLVGILPLWLIFRKPVTDRKAVYVAILCGLLFASDIAMWNTSIMLTKASISTLLANLAPVWVGLGTLLILKEKVGKYYWFGVITAILGIILIIGTDIFSDFNLSLGNSLAIGASFFYAAYQLTVKKGRNTLDTFSFTFISILSSTVLLGLICLVSGVQMWGFSSQSWTALVLLGLFPQVVGWLLINQALGHIRPTVASVSLLFQPVLTAVFSVPVLAEYLSWYELLGGLIVLLGIYLVNRR